MMKNPVAITFAGVLGILTIACMADGTQVLGQENNRQPTIEQRLLDLEQRVTELERRLGHESSRATDPATTGGDPNIPAVVRSRLDQLHPGGQVIESGWDIEDGYWWFDVRRDGQLFDVEISNEGQVIENQITED